MQHATRTGREISQSAAVGGGASTALDPHEVLDVGLVAGTQHVDVQCLGVRRSAAARWLATRAAVLASMHASSLLLSLTRTSRAG